MSNQSEDIQAVGSDTRPPMLDRTDFESWQQRIRLYYKGKDHGEYIFQSIDEGPFKMGTCRDEVASDTDSSTLGPERDRVVADLSQPEKDRLRADIRATNILLKGLPRDIYKLINHNTYAKDIWDNVKMLLEGSELTKDDRESQLYDEFKHFRQHKGENIHDYYVRFTKLMRHIKMTMPKIQLNFKFVNNMLPEWGRFGTVVKLNKGLKEYNHCQLYAYLKQHEVHANENKLLMERLNQQSNDPLALVSNISPYQYPSSSSVQPQSSYIPPVTYQPQFADNTQPDTSLSPANELLDNLTKQNGRVVVQNVQGRQNRVQGNNARGAVVAGNGVAQNRDEKMLLMQAQENRVDLDEEQLLFLAADQCDAFNFDVDEAPTAQTMFMANLFSADPVDDAAGPSYDSDFISEVQDHDNYLDNMNEYPEGHEMQNDVQPNNVVDSDTVT
ncbi:hypothetical protein Tco_1457244 [Tanacetum coccineum]